MKYMGSKNRIAKHILPIILKDRKPNQWYVEPFAGGMNMIDKVNGNRIANDSNYYLMQMWEALVNDEWIPNTHISKDTYNQIKNNRENYEPWLVGWVAFNCSYSGKYFGGYAGEIKTKDGKDRNYQKEARKNVDKQLPKLKGVTLSNKSYDEMMIPPNSIIYCDPPYKGTTKYKDTFDSDKFYEWCRNKAKEGHKVYMSEYSAPSDFVEIWSKDVKSSLSANGKVGGSLKSTERLYFISP